MGKYWNMEKSEFVRYLQLILFSSMLLLFLNCEDNNDRINEYRFYDSIACELHYDTVQVYVAAYWQPETKNRIPFQLVPESETEDTLRLVLSVIGEGIHDSPRVNKYTFWRAETLYVWYSGFPFDSTRVVLPQLVDLGPFKVVAVNPPPPPWFRIEDMAIYAPSGSDVIFHDEVLKWDGN